MVRLLQQIWRRLGPVAATLALVLFATGPSIDTYICGGEEPVMSLPPSMANRLGAIRPEGARDGRRPRAFSHCHCHQSRGRTPVVRRS